MNFDDFDVTQPVGMIDYLRARIRELKERESQEIKRAFFAGHDAGSDQHIHWTDAHTAFDSYLQQRGKR